MINKILTINGIIKQSNDDQYSFFTHDKSLILPISFKNEMTDYVNELENLPASLILDISFTLKFKKGLWSFNKNKNELSIQNSVILENSLKEYQISDLLIEIYQLNGSDVLDSIIEYSINQLIVSGQLATEIDELDKYNQDWTYEEAKYALEIYKASMKMDTIGLNHLIDDYIRTGKLQRTVSAIKYKLANFKHLETLEDEGLGNVGQVFKDVFFEKK